MTSDPESSLFDFAASSRVPTNDEERTVTEVHAALGNTRVPLRLRRPPLPAPPPRWRDYLHAAIATVLVLALATAGFFAIQQQTTTPSPTEIPEVVLGLAGQDASPIASATCDLSGDVPIFSGLNASPIDGPAVLVTLDRELKLVCDDEETLLAEEVIMANATRTPHVLQAFTIEGTLLINVVSSEQLFIPHGEDTSQQQISAEGWGTWMVMNSTDDVSRASLYNLETFAEHPIEARGNRVGLGSIAITSSNAYSDTMAIAISFQTETGSQYLSGFFVASIDGETKYIQTQPDRAPRQWMVSPDGTTIAASSYEGTMQSGATTLRTYSTEDGSTLNSWSFETRDTFIDLAWREDGSSLLVADGSALYEIITSESEPEIIFEGESVQALMFTPDPNVVAIGHVEVLDSVPAKPLTSIINLETGDAITLEGRDFWAGPVFTTERTTLILADNLQGLPGETHIITAVDSTNGKVVGTMEYTIPADRGFSNSSWGTGKGNITVLAFSPNSMWQIVDNSGNPALIKVEPPPIDSDAEEEPVMLMTTSDGSASLTIFDPASTWIKTPTNQEWIEVEQPEPVESPGMVPIIEFVPGSD